MFNSKERVKKIDAEVVLTSGQKMRGHVILPLTSDLFRTLNGEGKFIQFASYGGKNHMLAKTAIETVSTQDAPVVETLVAVPENGSFNPHAVLGVDKKTPFGVIETRFEILKQSYHPSKFTGEHIPDEITEYAMQMSRVIAFAFDTLKNKGTGSDADDPTTSA